MTNDGSSVLYNLFSNDYVDRIKVNIGRSEGAWFPLYIFDRRVKTYR